MRDCATPSKPRIFLPLFKLYLPVLSMVFLILMIPDRAACISSTAGGPSGIDGEARIEGWISVDRNFQGRVSTRIAPTVMSRSKFVETALVSYEAQMPLAGANISFSNEGRVTTTNELGYFGFERRFARGERVPIRISAPGIAAQVDLDPGNQLHVVMHIRIFSSGEIEAYLLKEERGPGTTRSVVLLLPGLTLEGDSEPNGAPMTNWRTAYDLLASDPDLRGIDFYLLCAVKDLEVVESSQRLACFLHLTRRAYGPKARITLLGHSAGGLVARHCSVSTFFVPGSLDDFLMIASPNQGGAGSIALFGLLGLGREDYTGLKSALPFASRWDDLLGCLNNREPTVDCSGRFFIDKRLQDNRGLNPNVPCAILAGEVRDQVINQSEDLRNELGGIVEDLFGQEAGTMAKEVMRNVDKGLLERMPEGDLLFSLESQLIPGVPYKVLPYQHGTIHQPHSRNDIRYRAMKHFILNGSLGANSLLP